MICDADESGSRVRRAESTVRKRANRTEEKDWKDCAGIPVKQGHMGRRAHDRA